MYEFYEYKTGIKNWHETVISGRCRMGSKELLNMVGETIFSEGEQSS
jgi:hypothetical protein